MTSEGNKPVGPGEPLTASSGAKRKRGRPRKYEYSTYQQPQMAQPIQSIPPLRSTLYNSNIRQDGVHMTHTSGATADTRMHTVYVLPAQPIHGDSSTRPRDSGNNTVKTQENQAFSYGTAHVQGNSGKDVILGKHFVGKMTKQSPGFSLITVKVKDNHVLRGCIPDAYNLLPITPKDDLAPELPMLRLSQVQKKPSAIHRQAPTPLPVRLEDVTIAKPLQMRRPVEKSNAKHIIPPIPRPYIGSGVLAATPISVKSGNAESACLEPSVTAVPVKSAQPVLISCTQVDNQNVPVEENSLPEVSSDYESSDGSDESSGQIQSVDPAAPYRIEITSGSKDQSNAASSKQHICKEPSDNAEQSERPKTEANVLKEVHGSMTGASDGVQSVEEDDEMKVDSK
ncbi:uncharacterized protein LOC124675478 [Lolium rigidum]|uniref:uncharacterized protein LOC124675478 n=1 Tax=Lolium rigidum TaxID=89674 RepID=UPI001F5D62B0|nr:uncharacterized protein LOC124675478 [Lolium rigidum]XP_047067512.1 uncharacterized protein LOC124675478 [Lolium rigidum]